MHQDTIRLFVSSTFNDFQAEREALQISVFPALRELCESHGITFQAIDLRWGVSAEHVNRHLTMDVCLEEVKRCLDESPKPNFLGILGNRWGWQPAPRYIRDELVEIIKRTMGSDDDSLFLEQCYPISSLDCNAVPPVRQLDLGAPEGRGSNETRLRGLLEAQVGRVQFSKEEQSFLELSATAMEFQVALMEKEYFAELESSVLVIERTIAGLPLDSGSYPYIDIFDAKFCTLHAERLDGLKRHLRTLLTSSQFLSYSEKWIGLAAATDARGLNPEITHDGLADFARQVLSTLAEQVQGRIAEISKREPTELEQELHERFGVEACRVFAGQSADMEALKNVFQTQGLEQPATLVVGTAGGGTTTLIARCVVDCITEIKPRLIVRYINSSPNSSSAKLLMTDLFAQISPHVPLPSLPTRIQLALCKLLSETAYTLVIDGIDHLSSEDAEWLLSCFPEKIPQGSSVIFSCASTSSLKRSAKTHHMRKLEIGALSIDDGRDMLTAWMADGLRPRSLTVDQHEHVMQAFNLAGRSPLYLRLAALIARRWKSSDTTPLLAASLGELIASYFLLLTTESLHGPVLLRTSLSIIGASRSGIAEVELLDILSSDEAVIQEYHESNPFAPVIGRLPDIVWSRLYSEIKPFLSLSNAQTRPVIRFRHREFQQVVDKGMLIGANGLAIRTRMVAYFEKQRTLGKSGNYAPLRMRPFHEIPWQLLQSGKVEALKDFLVRPDVLLGMMDSYSIDPVKGLVVGNLVHDLAMYWSVLQKNGYDLRAELLECVKGHMVSVEGSAKSMPEIPTANLQDITQLVKSVLTVKIDRLLNYMGEKPLDNPTEFSSPGIEEESFIDELGGLFDLKREQLILMIRIKDDIKTKGHTDRERASRLIKLSNELKGSKEIAQKFITDFEVVAINFDKEFAVGYLGAINWLPMAYSYYLLEQPDRSIATFIDVCERLANAPGKEFLNYQIRVEKDCAAAMHSVGRHNLACERLLTAVALMEANGAGWQDRISTLLNTTFDIAMEADFSTNQLSMLHRLATYKTKYFLGGEDVLATIKLLKFITHHPLQAESEYSAEIQELLLKACRVGLGKYMDAKMFDETRQWATYCLPIYEKVFGVQGDRTQALRRILETS